MLFVICDIKIYDGGLFHFLVETALARTRTGKISSNLYFAHLPVGLRSFPSSKFDGVDRESSLWDSSATADKLPTASQVPMLVSVTWLSLLTVEFLVWH